MNITRAYTLGFCCGLGFSYHKLHKLSFDASTNNPYWITTKTWLITGYDIIP